MRLDESTWTVVHEAFHNVSEDSKQFPVVLSQISDRAIITVSYPEAKATWYTAGYLRQFWNRGGFVPVLASRTKIPLNQSFVTSLEPLSSSTLWFMPKDWIPRFYLTVEIRHYP